MTFWKVSTGLYLTAGKNRSGYQISHAAGWWCLYHLANIENQQSAEWLREFRYLNEAKKFAREHNAAQPEREDF